MTDETVPQNVRSFIAEFVDSVIHLEILLLLSRIRPGSMSASDVGKDLGIRPEWAESELATLCARGLLEVSGDTMRIYRYAPRTAELDAAVAGLERAYRERRVTVINLIFAKPIDRLHDFADAFRLRKDKPNA